MKSKNLRKLSFNKTTITKLNNLQLNSVNGGLPAAAPTEDVICDTGDCGGGGGDSVVWNCTDPDGCLFTGDYSECDCF